MQSRRTPGVEHDGVKEMTASLNHDWQDTSEIGTVLSALFRGVERNVHSESVWDDGRSHDGNSDNDDP